MKRGRRIRWSEAEWVAFGNQVKRVRESVQDLIRDSQSVSKAGDMNAITRAVRAIDRWKSRMETNACRDVSTNIVTRLFYGDPIDDSVNPISGNPLHE